jgi:hypothetical protein
MYVDWPLCDGKKLAPGEVQVCDQAAGGALVVLQHSCVALELHQYQVLVYA